MDRALSLAKASWLFTARTKPAHLTKAKAGQHIGHAKAEGLKCNIQHNV